MTRRGWKIVVAVAVAATSLAWTTGSALPAGAADTELHAMCDLASVPPVALSLDTTLGPDGNVWFTSNLYMVGKVTPAGVATTYDLPDANIPVSITPGPDDDLWFTTQLTSSIGRITTDGDLTIFTDGIPPDAKLSGIVLGPDGNLWFGTTGAIGEITPEGTVTYHAVGDPTAVVHSPVLGPEGKLWFGADASIGAITPDGGVTLFPTTASTDLNDWPGELAVGADGNIWYTIADGRIGRITPTGAVTEFTPPPPPTWAAYYVWDVAVDAAADGGTYRLGISVDGGPAEVTAPVAYDAGTVALQAAISALPSIGANGVSVAGTEIKFVREGVAAKVIAITVIEDAVTDGGVTTTHPTTVSSRRFAPVGLASISPAADGSLWFAEFFGSRIGRITTDGAISIVATLTSRTALPDLPGFVDQLVWPMLPSALTLGADGNIWLTIRSAGNDTVAFGGLGHLNPDGTLTVYSGATLPPAELVVGPDGTAWSFGPGLAAVQSVTADGVASIDLRLSFPLRGPIALTPGGIAVGTDGNLWLTAPLAVGGSPGDDGLSLTDGIVRRTPDGAWTLYGPEAGITPDSNPAGIVSGPDGALWFAEPGVNQIGRITTAGVVTEFSQGITRAPQAIAVGGDGNLWFTAGDVGQPRYLGRITPQGVVTEFDPGIAEESTITALSGGPDGNVWFTDPSGRVGRITPAGTVTWFEVDLPDVAYITSIAVGADGALWFSPLTSGRPTPLGRITTDGEITYYDVSAPQVRPGPPVLMTDLAAGPDGSLWIGRFGNPALMQMTVPDRVGEPCDHDEDGDTHLDYPGEDAFPLDPAEWADTDTDTVGDNGDNCAALANEDQANHDTDELGDACDTDDDGDGLLDSADPKPLDPDADDDTKLDGADNCVLVANTDQANFDHDALGDLCDPDDDDDTFADTADAFPENPAEWLDTDGDHIGNNADTDDDADGLIDTKDPKPLDPDTDDDGRLDGADNCVSKANPNQADADHDGIGDVCDRTVFVKISPRKGLSLEATVVDGGGLPVAGKRIVFTYRYGGQICTAVTDAKGKARCGLGLGLVFRLLGGYQATFNGDTLHDPASAKTWR